MGDSSRGGGRKHSNQNLRPTRGGGGHHAPNAAPNAGIKSGMTVEDLKRLTQKRMQESAIAAAAAVAANSSVHVGEVLTPKARPTISVPLGTPQHVVQAPPAAFTPKTGMSVQELKQLTTLRLASQNTPTHQQQQQQLPLTPTAATTNPQSNDYKSMLQQYYSRVNTPTSSPGNTPKRLGGRSFTTDHPPSQHHQQQSSPNVQLSKPGQATTRAAAVSADSRHRAQSIDNRRPAYTQDFYQPQQEQLLSPRHMSNSQRHPYDAIPDPPQSGYSSLGRQAVQFEADSFPPPPPVDDLGSFGVPTALPSWSPPPMRTKSLQDSRPTLSLYHHQSGFYAPPAAPASDDYDQTGLNGAFPPPPPGLTRRPSMTVPWQVAESVLHTPQQPTGRKQIVSVPETPFHQFAQAYPQTKGGLANGGAPSPPRMPLHRGVSGTSAAAAAAAAELNATPLVRQSSKDPNNSVPQPQLTRRGSFGNAAQMYRFRRRSKSRLDVARDLALLELNGEDVRNLSAEERELLLLQQGSDDGYGQERYSTSDLDDLKGSDDFVPYFNHRGGPKLSIPPPPPPMDDDSDSDEAGLPMMSPNGAKLRKVAQLARSGSLSSEDKTRVKDEIIQNSLGMMSLLPDDLSSAPPGFAPQGGWNKPKKSPSRPPGIVRSHPRAMSTDSSSNPVSLEDRLALAAQRVAECVAKSDMVEFQKAMDALDKLRHEANQLMQQ